MAIEFVLPMIASILQSAIGQGLAANQAANARNEQIKMARERRQELQPIIDSLRKARDYFGVEEQLVRDFSRASDQMAAQSAQTGMTNAGSGGLDANRSDLLGSMLAQLAQYKAGEEAQRQQLLAELLSDPSLYAGSLEESNVGGQTLLGGLLGGVAGAGSQLNAYLSTPEGIGILQNVGKKPGPETPYIPDPSMLRAPTMNMDIATAAPAVRRLPSLTGPTIAPRTPTPMGIMSQPAAAPNGVSSYYNTGLFHR